MEQLKNYSKINIFLFYNEFDWITQVAQQRPFFSISCKTYYKEPMGRKKFWSVSPSHAADDVWPGPEHTTIF